jgi:Sporulation and spore germination
MIADMKPWHVVWVAVLAAPLIALAACGGGGAPPTPVPTTSLVEPQSRLTATSIAEPPTRGLARPVPAQSGPVTIYLPRLFEDGSLGLRAASRPATLPDDPARDAIESLVRGPSGDERAADFEYALDQRSRLRSVGVNGGTVTVDFESGIDRVHGRPFSELVYWSIVCTLTDVPAVDRVALSYRGDPLREIGYPPFPVPPFATRADVPDWARPR